MEIALEPRLVPCQHIGDVISSARSDTDRDPAVTEPQSKQSVDEPIGLLTSQTTR